MKETCSPLLPIEDPQSRQAYACLEGLISDVKRGARLLLLSPVALLETFNAFPELHGAWCNSIFSMTAGKGNQVIKCEKSEARLGSPFCSVSFPNAAVQLWPPGEGLGGQWGSHKGFRLPECTQLVVRIQQASHVLPKCHYFPSTWKAPAGGTFRHSYMLSALKLHCLGADLGPLGRG